MSNELSIMYGRRKAKANAVSRKEKAARDEKARKERESQVTFRKPASTPVSRREEPPKRTVSKLGNSIPPIGPDVTVTEEARRKLLEQTLQEKLRERKLNRLVALDSDARSELLHRKSIRAAGGKKAKGADPKEDPVVMSDKEFETKAAEILGLRPKAEPAKAMPWMPTDTSKKKGGYRREDFFGNWNSARSDRFQGGYRDPAFRESFIEGRMKGLKPGDAGYDRAYSAAKSAWGQAERQYDRRFREFGDSVLKEQRRRSIDAGGPTTLVKPDPFARMPNGVPTATIVSDVESAVANGARNVSVTIGNTTVRGGSQIGPKVGQKVGANGVYAGNGTYEFMKPKTKSWEDMV